MGLQTDSENLLEGKEDQPINFGHAECGKRLVCKQRVLRFFGHIIRKDGSSLEKLMIERKIEGKMGRGRTPMRSHGYPLEVVLNHCPGCMRIPHNTTIVNHQV